MAIDLTDNIKSILYPYGFETADKIEIIACDDLDNEYIIRAKDGYASWLDAVAANRDKLSIESVAAPERGVIEVKVKKICPSLFRAPHLDNYPDDFLKGVEEYFGDLFRGLHFNISDFRCREKPTTEMVDASYVAHNDEGDEMGWVEAESEAYVGSTFYLDGPMSGEEEMYCRMSEELQEFISRKFASFFGKKRAACEVKEKKWCHDEDAVFHHYTFSVWVS